MCQTHNCIKTINTKFVFSQIKNNLLLIINLKVVKILWQLFFSMYIPILLLFTMKQFSPTHSLPHYRFGDIQYTIQSPIDIRLSEVVYLYLPPLVFHLYPNIDQHILVMENNGYTVEVHPLQYDHQLPFLTGGPLDDDLFLFENLHLHWGQKDNDGSEHHLNDHSYSCEVHIVYYNQMYGSFEQARDKINGLAVLAFFGVAVDEDNESMEEFINDLQYIQEPGYQTYTNFGRIFSWIETIIYDQDWISYPGSLSTPPYWESVTWIVMTTPFTLSHRQLNQFRTLYKKDHQKMIGNNRSIQYSNWRPVIGMINQFWPFVTNSIIVDPHFTI